LTCQPLTGRAGRSPPGAGHQVRHDRGELAGTCSQTKWPQRRGDRCGGRCSCAKGARQTRRSARRDAHAGPSAVRADQGDRHSVGNARSSSRIEGVERPTCFVRGLACSLVVLGQAMFWCVGTFQDSRPIPKESRAQNWRAGPADTASGPAAWVGSGRITRERTCRCQRLLVVRRAHLMEPGGDDDQGLGDVGSGCRSHQTAGSNLGCAAPNGDPESGSPSGSPPRTGWR
jgi:hypothetical protein